MIVPRYLKFSTSSSLWPFILISLWKPFVLFVITFVLSEPISILYLVVVLSRRSIRTPASSSSSAFTTMSSAKLVMSRPPMQTLPSWSSKASHIILSRKMLKRVGESRHPCRTPTVVLNHSAVLPLNRTALWALSYRFSMARMMLALMLYFLIVALSWSLWRHGRDSADATGISRRGSWDRIFVLWCSFRLWNLPALLQWSLLLVAGVCLWSSACPLLGWLIRLMVLYFWHSCKLPFFGSVITRDWVHVVGHSPVLQILLQIAVRMSIMASPPAWTNSAGMLSMPADFPIFSAFTAASTSSRRIGWSYSSGICGQSSTIGSPSVS